MQIFLSLDSDSESEDINALEIWKCAVDSCGATVKIQNSLVRDHAEHCCQPNLKIDVDKKCGILDGYVFVKDSGNIVTTPTEPQLSST